VHDDVHAARAEVRLQLRDGPLDAAVAVIAVALRLAQLHRHVLVRVEVGVEGVDALEAELAAVAHRQRRLHLALEQGAEDPEGGRPGAQADAGARLGQRLGDGEPEAAVIGDAGHERALAPKVDADHGGGYYYRGGTL
jgi:hypothetical protein